MEYVGKKMILGCSGGPDSMALLDMARKCGVILHVAHVNYQHRPTANRDQKITEDYCQKYNIPCTVFYPKNEQGNFQAWAREVRYDFFKECKEKYQAEGILIAHQKDDFLETYLFQKKRNCIPEYWGLKEKGNWKGTLIYRPLLNYRKKELEAYCINNQIDYGIDESNLTNDYQRNEIRHSIVEKMDEATVEQLISQIDDLNKNKEKKMALYQAAYQTNLNLNILDSFQEADEFLMFWIKKKTGLIISKKQAEDLVRQLHGDGNFEVSLKNCVKLSKMYDCIEINEENDVSYCYVLDKIEMLKTPYFEIKETGKGTEALTLYESDFPITIRNAQKEDRITMRFGTKKLSRWFIDRKIPRNQRKSWPVVLNCQGNVILVPQIGCDVEHYSNNPTCFVVK